jgi:hypothetical protein
MKMSNQVSITKVYLNVGEGSLAGMQLHNGNTTAAEAILNLVQQAMPDCQMGYDKVDITATVACNGDEYEIGIRYDIKRDTKIDLLARLHDSVNWWANSEFSTPAQKEVAQEWLARDW